MFSKFGKLTFATSCITTSFIKHWQSFFPQTKNREEETLFAMLPGEAEIAQRNKAANREAFRRP